MRSFKILFFALSISLLTACGSTFFGGAPQLGDEEYAPDLSDENVALHERERWNPGENIPTGQANGIFSDIYFDYDSSIVKNDEQDIVRRSASALKDDPTLMVEVEGHCDKRGTSEYNLALGEQRAKSVRDLLVNYGIEARRISTVSYGEEIPVDSADNEDAYAKNRRAHFAVFRLKRK